MVLSRPSVPAPPLRFVTMDYREDAAGARWLAWPLTLAADCLCRRVTKEEAAVRPFIRKRCFNTESLFWRRRAMIASAWHPARAQVVHELMWNEQSDRDEGWWCLFSRQMSTGHIVCIHQASAAELYIGTYTRYHTENTRVKCVRWHENMFCDFT